MNICMLFFRKMLIVFCISYGFQCYGQESGNTSINNCSQSNLDSLLQKINESPKYISDLSDDCAIMILDTLASLYITNYEVKYLQYLESICQVSDGYISEQISSEFEKFKGSSLKGLLEFLYDKERCIRELFSFFLYQAVDISVDPKWKYNQIRNDYMYELKELGTSKEIIDYFLLLLEDSQKYNSFD